MRTFSRPACCRGTRSLACLDGAPRGRRAVASPPKRPSTRRAVLSHRGAKAGANLTRGSLLPPPSSFLWATSGPRLKPGVTWDYGRAPSLRGDDFDLAPGHPRWAERRLDAEETYPSNRLERGEDKHVGVGRRAAESVQPDEFPSRAVSLTVDHVRRLPGRGLADGKANRGDVVGSAQVDLDPLQRTAAGIPTRPRIAVNGEGPALTVEYARCAGALLERQIGPRALASKAERGAVLEVGPDEAGEGVGPAVRKRR